MEKIKIEKLDHQGRGIGFLDHKITFVFNALPFEEGLCRIKKAKKNYNEGEMVQYLKKSDERVKAFCPFYLDCGGCHLEHMTYLNTLKFKEGKVENILKKNKIEYPKIEVVDNAMPKNYRNKLSLKIKEGKIGFYKENTHDLVEIDKCLLAKDSINTCLRKIKHLKIKNGSVLIRSNYNDEILLVINTKDKIEFKKDFFLDIKLVGVILNNQTIYGNNYFYERIHHFLFKVSYDAFFQVNYEVTNKLFSILEENLECSNIVLDLYSGVGTLGIVASKNAKKVYSIEIVKNAVLDNLENKRLNKKENIFPMLGDAYQVLSKIKDKFDTIIIDPPRSGLDKNALEIILKEEAKKVIYISCDPLTLARDLKELIKNYSIQKFYVLDMFSYTYHVESVCILKRSGLNEK